MDREIGIIMAAGLGSRMRPLTETVPKPLVKVCGKPMVETVIEALGHRGIHDIYVVAGYRKEQFSYLPEKYNGIILVENKNYQTKNNISSLYAVKDVLGTADCFICEADLWIRDFSFLNRELDVSGYFGKRVEGYCEDWIFEIQDDFISRIKKGGSDTFQMVGMSYFKRNDARVLSQKIVEAYQKEENSGLYWDEVVDASLQELRLKVWPVVEGQIIEIDTVEELNAVNEM